MLGESWIVLQGTCSVTWTSLHQQRGGFALSGSFEVISGSVFKKRYGHTHLPSVTTLWQPRGHRLCACVCVCVYVWRGCNLCELHTLAVHNYICPSGHVYIRKTVCEWFLSKQKGKSKDNILRIIWSIKKVYCATLYWGYSIFSSSAHRTLPLYDTLWKESAFIQSM